MSRSGSLGLSRVVLPAAVLAAVSLGHIPQGRAGLLYGLGWGQLDPPPSPGGVSEGVLPRPASCRLPRGLFPGEQVMGCALPT